jgi:siderophore synthetase component
MRTPFFGLKIFRSTWCLAAVLAVASALPALAGPTAAERELSKRDPQLGQLIHYEQQVNEKVENSNQFATIRRVRLPQEYRPESGAVFKLWTVEVPEDRVALWVTGEAPESRVFVTRGGKRYVKFYVHPHSEELFRKYLPEAKWTQELSAAATSSYRSLIAWGPKDEPFGVKVSLDATIGQVWRVLKRDQIETSAAISSWLGTVSKKKWEKQGALFLDEPVNGFLKGPDIGFSLRNYPQVKDGHQLMPLFSFYSRDAGAPPAVLQALKRAVEATGISPQEWVDQNLIEPQIRHFTRMMMEEGVVGAPHEQNVMIELDREGNPTGRFHYRDTGGFSVDAELRRAAGKDLSFIPEGIAHESVLLMKGHPLDAASNYFVNSNFFALRAALQEEYPEISETFIMDRYRKRLVENLQPELGKLPLNLREIRSAIAHRRRMAPETVSVRGKDRGCISAFQAIAGGAR